MSNQRKSTVENAIESIPIAIVKADLRRYLSTCFTDEEQAHFENRPERSVAAALCVKRAICRLGKGLSGRAILVEKHVVLSHNRPGALIVRSVRGKSILAIAFQTGGLFVSASHSRSTAYALASVQRDSK